jgi:glycosyltransferase involved in cell wall biosynthesis
MLQIAHFIPYTGTAMGGPVIGLAAYTSLLADFGYPITVYSALNGADGESVRLDSRVTLVQEPGARAGGFRRSRALWRRAEAADVALVHSWGLWTDVNRLAGDLARRRGLPHLLAPCGMLAPAALRHHWWKKLPARLWFQDRALREAQCLHAKSYKEYQDIRRLGLRNPVAIVANPIFLPPWEDAAADRPAPLFLPHDAGRGQGEVESADGHRSRPLPSTISGQALGKEGFKDTFRRACRIPGDKKIALFLGRLHRTKGPARLVQAWSTLREHHPHWVCVLAGPDEGGYRGDVESLVVELGCNGSVMFTGELDNVQKWGALAAADVFVMPSDFENFGNSIVEAMLCAVPVITTTGTPWRELPRIGAGWWVRPAADELAGALREALAMSDEQRQEMGRKALRLADQFRPERSVQDLRQVYRWLLSEGERPTCVRMD